MFAAIEQHQRDVRPHGSEGKRERKEAHHVGEGRKKKDAIRGSLFESQKPPGVPPSSDLAGSLFVRILVCAPRRLSPPLASRRSRSDCSWAFRLAMQLAAPALRSSVRWPALALMTRCAHMDTAGKHTITHITSTHLECMKHAQHDTTWRVHQQPRLASTYIL
jgi:hypothetical protein